MRPFNVDALLLVLLAQVIIVVHGIVEPSCQCGQLSAYKQFPYYATLIRDKEYQCGGSIIDARWILTAASCVVEEDGTPTTPEVLDVHVGTIYFQANGPLKPEKVFPHESYTLAGYKHDIALIKLKNAIKFDDEIQKIELIRERPPVPASLTIFSYKFPSTFKSSLPQLAFYTIFSVSDNHCDAKEVLCVENRYEYGSYKEFIGSPVVYEQKQVGVATNSFSGESSHFTDVIFHYEWIAETMKE